MRIINLMCGLAAITCIFSNCKKNNSSVTTDPADDDCVVQNSLQNGEIIEGQYIVAYHPTGTDRTLSVKSLGELNAVVLQRNKISEAALQRSFPGVPGGFVARLTREEVNRLKADNTIGTIEPDRLVALSHCFKVVEPRLITWNINKVGYGDGTGKTVWVIDSGIDLDHPDLNVDVSRSRSFLNDETSANDENGHGTHVAGIIGAKNNTIGVLGVASGCNLVALKVLGKDGVGPLSAIIQALAWVNTNGKAGDVINLSLGEEETSTILDQQVQNTAAKGIYIAIAAGNDGKPAVNYSPGRANGPNIYTVSAIDSLGNFASFSNYGNDVVDFAAPGVRVVSTWTNGRYARLSGTSMAAPHVAGLLLLNGGNIKSSGTAKNDPDGIPDPIAHQ